MAATLPISGLPEREIQIQIIRIRCLHCLRTRFDGKLSYEPLGAWIDGRWLFRQVARLGQVADHVSPHMILSNYREIVTPKEADQYWQIFPPSPGRERRANGAGIVTFVDPGLSQNPCLGPFSLYEVKKPCHWLCPAIPTSCCPTFLLIVLLYWLGNFGLFSRTLAIFVFFIPRSLSE
jgi:hypothetical protein